MKKEARSIVTFSVTVVIAIVLAAWCATLAYGITDWWRLLFFALPPLATVWSVRAIHKTTGKYTDSKIELLFCACVPVIAAGLLTPCTAMFVVGAENFNDIMGWPAICSLETAFIAMAVSMWRKVDADAPRHMIYAGRLVTIAFVLGLAKEMIEQAIELPEIMTGILKWYLIASMGYFFLIGLPQVLIKSFKK